MTIYEHKGGKTPKPELARAFANFEFDKSGCWLWSRGLNSQGYAQIRDRNRKTIKVHRLIYEAFRGTIPEGLVIDHLCRVRHCVNPFHLEPVSNAENIRRSPIMGKHAKRQLAITHCPRGHEYAGENLYVSSENERSCRVCRRAAQRAYQKRIKEKRAATQK